MKQLRIILATGRFGRCQQRDGSRTVAAAYARARPLALQAECKVGLEAIVKILELLTLRGLQGSAITIAVLSQVVLRLRAFGGIRIQHGHKRDAQPAGPLLYA